MNPVGKITIRAKPLPRKPSSVRTEQLEASEDDESGLGPSPGPGTGPGSGAGPGFGGGPGPSQAEKRRTPIDLDNVRTVGVSGAKRKVYVTPNFSGKMRISVFEAGADLDRQLTVKRASSGAIEDGSVSGINVSGGQRLSIEIELSERFEGAMKVVGYEV